MTESTALVDDDVADESSGPIVVRSLTEDAWRELKRNPLFWVSLFLIVLFGTMATVPQLFTQTDPTAATLKLSRQGPSAEAWFGRDVQGYDIFARTIYGARASILVGVLTSVITATVGSFLGVLAAYTGGWLDALISRIADVFFAIPLLLGGILFLSTFPSTDSSYFVVVFKVVLVMVVFGWPSLFRLMRAMVLQVKPNDYVQAAKALGASPLRVIFQHIVPNALTPVIVVATINLGAYITAEASLSFLGIGLTQPTISWGVMISDSLTAIRVAPHVLLFPSLFLSLAVLAFIMLGDAVRDAYDPKSR